MSTLEKERERLLDFFSARYYDCETDHQKFAVRQQLLSALAKLESGIITEKIIKEVDGILEKPRLQNW